MKTIVFLRIGSRVLALGTSLTTRLSASVAGLVLAALGLALPTSGAEFTLVATHPDAAAQATATGRTLGTLKPFNGKLYAGFGDIDINTGPIGIRAYDPLTGGFSAQLLNFQTEAISIYREIGGKLYAPTIDPWPSPPTETEGINGGYAVGSISGSMETWRDSMPVRAAHVFDITIFDTDLWMVGSKPPDTPGATSNAAVWHSTDGGENWEVSLDVPPQAANAIGARFSSIIEYEGKLYTQGLDIIGTVGTLQSISKVFDGVSWSDGPSLGGGFTGSIWHPEVFAGQMVYHRNLGGVFRRIFKFDGSQVSFAFSNESFYDYTISDGVLYALRADERIFRTTDLVSWNLLDTAPANGRSLGVLDNVLYVGGTEGQLYEYSLAVPEPATCWLLIFFSLLMLRRTRKPIERSPSGNLAAKGQPKSVLANKV